MSRDPVDQDPPEPDEGPPGQGGPGRLRTTGPGVLLGSFLAGLVGGWAVRPIAVGLDATAPLVTLLQGLVFYLVAAILLGVARATHRAVQQRQRLRPNEAVNRLVLAKSCALTAALVAGGYLGYALSWVGVDAELSSQRILLSLVASVGAALAVGASLLLERACRVRGGDDES